MPEAEFFLTPESKVTNPLRPYGVAQIIVGVSFLALAGLVLRAEFPFLRSVVGSRGRVVVATPDGTIRLVVVILAVVVFLAGLPRIGKAFGKIRRILIPPGVPKALDTSEIRGALSQKELQAYAAKSEVSFRLVERLFPHQFPLMTLGLKRFVRRGLREVVRGAMVAVLIGGAYAVFELLPPEIVSLIRPDPGPSLFVFVGILVLGSVIHGAAAARAVPEVVPRTEVVEFKARAHSRERPHEIPDGIQEELESIRRGSETPNRTILSGFEALEGSMQGAGSFKGQIVVENHPKLVEPPLDTSMKLLLVAAVLWQLMALALWFSKPAFVGAAYPIGAQNSALLVSWIAQLAGGVLLLSMGKRMAENAGERLEAFHYRSTGALLEVKGTYTRPSMASEEATPGTECSISGWAASLLTESRGLMGERHVVGMLSDAPAREIEDHVRGWLARFEGDGNRGREAAAAPGPGRGDEAKLQATVAWDPDDMRGLQEAATPGDEDVEPGEDPLVGQLIRNKWKVLKRLGAGSFGTVYKVKDVKGEWIEALKILGVDRITGAEAETARKRFLREAQIMKRLGAESQHIVGLSTYEEDLGAGLIYFLMEFVDGRSLGDVLREEGPLGVDRTVRLALQACDALIVAHEGPEGIVHRDLKLENLMVTTDRTGAEILKVLDFGIARLAERDPDSRLTTVGILGTPGYAAPEQIRAEDVDARTDLFAFGVILYLLLTGRDPWLGNPAGQSTEQIYELMLATDRGEVRPMAEAGRAILPAMERVVMRLLRRDPAERFQSARELKEALRRITAAEESNPDPGSGGGIGDESGRGAQEEQAS